MELQVVLASDVYDAGVRSLHRGEVRTGLGDAFHIPAFAMLGEWVLRMTRLDWENLRRRPRQPYLESIELLEWKFTGDVST